MPELSWFESYGEDDYNGYKMNELQKDEAYLNVFIQKDPKDDVTNNFYIYSKHKECIKCHFHALFNYGNGGKLINNSTIILENVPQQLYRITDSRLDILPADEKCICEFGSDFGEFGIYHANVSKTECTVQVFKEPVSIYFPILTVLMIYVAIILSAWAIFCAWKKFRRTSEKSINPDEESKPAKKRVQSLDTFRGISIVVMIFVNYGAGGYELFDHTIWNGLHLADLVFPWFMWIMGACIPISLSSSFKKQTPNSEIFINVLKRSLKLFFLGIFLNSGANLHSFRIFGVLQRFGICYFAVTTICMFTMRRNDFKRNNRFTKMFEDILKLAWGWGCIAIIVVIYLVIILLATENDCPRGYFGPGGFHDYQQYQNCTGGVTGYIDRLILGKHVYQFPTIKAIFKSPQPFDPEGILGCFTSIVHVFIGVQAGSILVVHKEHSARLIRWLSWALVSGLAGGALCGFSKEDGLIPVNKNLWSISFVFVTCSFAFMLLSFCYVLIDVKHWWSGKPFFFAGMNAILMYIGHEMTYGHLPMRWYLHEYQDLIKTHFNALFENLWGTGFWVLVSYYLFKINYFFTI